MNYRVKALSVLGLNNKIYNSGDMVSDKSFPDGNAEKLEKGGYIEKLSAPIEQPKEIELNIAVVAEKKRGRKSKKM